jgi:N-acetylneuraminate lyase
MKLLLEKLLLLLSLLLPQTTTSFIITGIVAPTFSPLDASGKLDVSLIPGHAEFLNASGVRWIFSAGSTGESVDLTVAERKSLAQAWVDIAPTYNMSVIVHVGTDSVIDAQDMASHAEKIGAQAIAAMPPTYIRPSSMDALLQTMGSIADAAPTTPFYYYHIPAKTGVDFLMSDFVQLADHQINSFRGIKFTHYALDDFQLAMDYVFQTGPSWRLGQNVNMLFGRDQFLLSAVAYGCHGAVGTTYNFNAHLQRFVLDANFSGDYETARTAMKATAEFIKSVIVLESQINGAYIWKMIAKAVGLKVGPARLPYIAPTKTSTDAVRNFLTDWCGTLETKMSPPWCNTVLKVVV